MPILANCSCGAKFKAKDDLAGKRVKCPSCAQPFEIPKRTAGIATRVTCQCGQAFQAKAELAGKRVKCPSCGAPLTIPLPNQASKKISVACQCGGTFRAKAELAGKRVKCPSCASVLMIPSAHALTSGNRPSSATANADLDPLGWGSELNDPLGLGSNSTSDLPGLASELDDIMASGASGSELPAAGTLLPKPKQTARSSPKNKPSKPRRKRQGETLTAVAGYVALLYGGFQLLFGAWGFIQQISVALNHGMGGMGIGFLWSVVLLGLAAWLAKSGLEIIQGDREGLENARQASMAYITLAILQLIAMVGVAFLFGRLFGNGLPGMGSLPIIGIMIFAVVVRVILTLPPVFIVYVASVHPSSR